MWSEAFEASAPQRVVPTPLLPFLAREDASNSPFCTSTSPSKIALVIAISSTSSVSALGTSRESRARTQSRCPASQAWCNAVLPVASRHSSVTAIPTETFQPTCGKRSAMQDIARKHRTHHGQMKTNGGGDGDGGAGGGTTGGKHPSDSQDHFAHC